MRSVLLLLSDSVDVAVQRGGESFTIETDRGVRVARAIVSATGTWASAIVPDHPGYETFEGEQLHSAGYRSPASFAGKRVVIVGAGNSGAQLVAELSQVANVTWATREPPRFLADHIDGRFLFQEESAVYAATMIGVGRTARETANQIAAELSLAKAPDEEEPRLCAMKK